MDPYLLSTDRPLTKCSSPTCGCRNDDAYSPGQTEPGQPLGEIPDSLPSIARAFRSIDSVADELRGLKVANAELQAENGQLKERADCWRGFAGTLQTQTDEAIEQRNDARASFDNPFPLLKAAEAQNERYARELEQLVGAQARLDEMDEALAYARGAGFDDGYETARKEQGMVS